MHPFAIAASIVEKFDKRHVAIGVAADGVISVSVNLDGALC